MKTKTFILIILSLQILGCKVLQKPIELVDGFIDSTFFPPYSGPKAKVVVADFEIMTAKATADISQNLKEFLISGLIKSQRFEVISLPKDSIDKPSGLIIAVKLVDFEPYGSGGKSGVGGAGSASSGSLYSLLGPVINRSYMTLDIRIVDADSSKILFSEKITGQASGDYVPEEGWPIDHEAGKGLALYSGTSMGEAINKCILDAVEYITQKVPQQYYKEGSEDGKTQTPGKT